MRQGLWPMSSHSSVPALAGAWYANIAASEVSGHAETTLAWRGARLGGGP